MARSGTTVCLALLLALFEFGSCLRCNQCTSQSAPDCGDPYNAGGRFSVDCNTQESINFNRQYLLPFIPSIQDGLPGAPRYCHKLVMNTGTVVRACLDANAADLNHTCRLLDSATRNTQQIRSCSVCDRDNCNGAGSIVASLPLALLTAVIAYMSYKQ